ncbi:MAG: fumarylacetoacetate hydrolase family protein [Dehalococcoidia bacterium]|nr:fumarylacetoacetate hydrolase family protein [Dehalococcoidia bacterium]
MRLCNFYQRDAVRVGAVANEWIVDLERAAKAAGASRWPSGADMKGLLETGPAALDEARRLTDYVAQRLESGEGELLLSEGLLLPAAETRLAAPVPNPSKVVAIGLNYRDHAREQGARIPDRPIIFAKFPTSVIGPGDEIVWDPALTEQVDYEAELAFVIGRAARNVPPEHAYDYIAGYTCLDDVSARDLQFGDRQWVRGKSLDTFCPIGPVLVTTDEIADPHNLRIRALLNGEVMQDSNTSELIFGVPELVAFISRAFTLLPGDVVATGTPHGVGMFRDPPVFMKDGDRIVIEIEGIGRLENVCRTVRASG